MMFHAVRHQTVQTRKTQDTFANKSVTFPFPKAGLYTAGHHGVSSRYCPYAMSVQGGIQTLAQRTLHNLLSSLFLIRNTVSKQELFGGGVRVLPHLRLALVRSPEAEEFFVLPGDEVDGGILQQRGEDKEETHRHPDVDGLDIRDLCTHTYRAIINLLL